MLMIPVKREREKRDGGRIREERRGEEREREREREEGERRDGGELGWGEWPRHPPRQPLANPSLTTPSSHAFAVAMELAFAFVDYSASSSKLGVTLQRLPNGYMPINTNL